MAKSARTPAKARAASIARAERLQREAAARGEAPKPARPRQPKPRPDRTRTPKGDRPSPARQSRQRAERQHDGPSHATTPRSVAAPAVARTPSLAYNIAAGRRQQHERRATIDRQREATQRAAQRFEAQRTADRQRAEARKQAEAKRQDQQRRDQMRGEFVRTAERRLQQDQRATVERQRQDRQRRERARADLAKAADRRRDHARRATVDGTDRRQWQQEWQGMTRQRLARQRQAAATIAIAREAQARAGAKIDADHKRQTLDQQGAHRFETADLKIRHEAAAQSLRRNEVLAVERHHAAIQGIDRREQEALADFDTRRTSLTGRLAEAVPGRRAANDEARAGMVQGFEAERVTKHRDLEVLQQRQFETAQRTGLDHIGQRLALQGAHIEQRRDLQHEQKAGRAELVKAGTRVIQRVERERAQADRVMQGHDRERERERPAPGFGRS